MRSRTLIALGLSSLLSVVSFGRAFGQGATPADPIATVTVDAKHPWVDSGLTVRKGERLSFRADGTIQWGSTSDKAAGPEGHGAKGDKIGPGGLIGRVGYNGKPFAIGNTRTPIVMPKDGKLFLGINDFIFGDNAGAFTVTIRRPSARSAGGSFTMRARPRCSPFARWRDDFPVQPLPAPFSVTLTESQMVGWRTEECGFLANDGPLTWECRPVHCRGFLRLSDRRQRETALSHARRERQPIRENGAFASGAGAALRCLRNAARRQSELYADAAVHHAAVEWCPRVDGPSAVWPRRRTDQRIVLRQSHIK